MISDLNEYLNEIIYQKIYLFYFEKIQYVLLDSKEFLIKYAKN
jgi:hypothetical protein